VLQVIPAQGYEDGPSLDFLRLGGIVPRKARLFMYRILGQRPPIPNERPETAVDYADHTVATFDSADIYTAPCLPGAARGLDAHERGQQLEAARGGYQYLHGYVETGAPAPRGKTWSSRSMTRGPRGPTRAPCRCPPSCVSFCPKSNTACTSRGVSTR
jgi:hypothetical protein